MKNNAEKMVTKKEFRATMAGMMAEIRVTMSTKVELSRAVTDLKETMVTKSEHGKSMRWLKADFDRSIAELKENMATKQDIARLMTLIDEIVTEVRASRQERLLREPQLLRIDDQVHDHEKRIRVLEKR